MSRIPRSGAESGSEIIHPKSRRLVVLCIPACPDLSRTICRRSRVSGRSCEDMQASNTSLNFNGKPQPCGRSWSLLRHPDFRDAFPSLSGPGNEVDRKSCEKPGPLRSSEHFAGSSLDKTRTCCLPKNPSFQANFLEFEKFRQNS